MRISQMALSIFEKRRTASTRPNSCAYLFYYQASFILRSNEQVEHTPKNFGCEHRKARIVSAGQRLEGVFNLGNIGDNVDHA